MMVIGVTGGVGTGKSTVARIFGKLGGVVLDADEIAHELMEPGTAVFKRILGQFGKGILKPNGTMDRKKLAESAFRSRGKLDALCRIIHPAVRLKIEKQLKAIRRKDPDAVAVLDIPLLIEAGSAYPVTALVVVSASLTSVAKRLQARSGWSFKELKRRQAFQLPLKVKERQADFVVRNNGDRTATRRQVVRIWKRLVTGRE